MMSGEARNLCCFPALNSGNKPTSPTRASVTNDKVVWPHQSTVDLASVSESLKISLVLLLQSYTEQSLITFGWREVILEKLNGEPNERTTTQVEQWEIDSSQSGIANLASVWPWDDGGRSDHQVEFNTWLSVSWRYPGEDSPISAIGSPSGCSKDDCVAAGPTFDWTCDLEINVECDEHGARISLEWAEPLLSQRHASELLNLFTHIFTTHTSLRMADYRDLVSLSQSNLETIAQWNSGGDQIPNQDSIHAIIQQQALEHPKSVAVRAWDGVLTFCELESLAESIQAHLQSLDIGSGSVVPVYGLRSMWTLVTLLGILRTGAAFLLLDPSHPLARTAHMCREVGARVIFTSPDPKDRISHLADAILLPRDVCADATTRPIEVVVAPDAAAYVAFTSGSTGVPKGIVVEHGSFLAGAVAHAKALAMDRQSQVLHFASHGFDVSLLELLAPAILGGCVCIPSEEQRLNSLAWTINHLGCNWACLTPSVARRVPPNSVPRLRSLVLAGEAMDQSDVKTWSPKLQLMNGYGPTECAVLCTAQPDIANSSFTNIGRSYGGSTWVVFPGDHDILQPIGAVGELLVSGPAVARGYLSMDMEQEDAFLQSPPSWAKMFNMLPSERFYKTGDLVRYDGDHGSLSYVGRKDNQVKIRGQRVELPEIEQTAHEMEPSIATAVETIQHPNTKELVLALFVAFKSASNQHPVEQPEFATASPLSALLPSLQTWLDDRLPRYMVPALYVPLQFLPVTSSGKLDRKKLRSCGIEYLRAQLHGQSCAKEEEDGIDSKTKTVRRLIGQSLGMRNGMLVGADDDFFALGGNSLMAIDLVSRAHQQGIEFTVAEIMGLRTSAKLALVARSSSLAGDPEPFELCPQYGQWIGAACAQSGTSLDSIQDVYPCTPLQKGIMSSAMRIPGSMVAIYAFSIAPDVNFRRFKAAWETVAEDPVLRTRIVETEDHDVVQIVVANDESCEWDMDTSLDLVVAKLESRDMSLGRPLVQFAVVQKDNSPSHFVLALHHAISDGWSYLHFWDDLQSAYHGRAFQKRPAFSRFVQYVSSQDPVAHKKFWTREFQDLQAIVFPSKPTGWNTPKLPMLQQVEASSAAMRGFNPPWPSIIRLALALVISNITNADDVVFGTTVSGRFAPVPGIDQIVGPTIAVHPLRVQVRPSETIQRALEELQERDAARVDFEHIGMQAIRQFSPDAAAACEFQTHLTIQPQQYTQPPSILVDLPRNRGEQRKFSAHVLSIVASITPTSIILEAVFDASVLDADKVQTILKRLRHVMGQIAHHPDHLIKFIEVITDEEKQSLAAWNQPHLPFIPDRIHNMILEMGRKTPFAEAVSAWDGVLQYKELLELSTSVAGYLKSLRVDPETVVAIYMERSKWLPVAVLGVLMHGAAFLLLDPKLPDRRLSQVCREADARIILTSSTQPASSITCLPVGGLVVTISEAAGYGCIQTIPSSGPSSKIMYMIFTSGTTGKPKSVYIEHDMCWSSFSAYQTTLPLSPSVRMLLLASVSFDIAVLQLLFPLAAGGCVCVPSEEECVSDIAGAITKHRANWLVTTPSVARTLIPGEVESLELVELGGEPMLPSDIVRWAGKVELWTSYGPAECAIMATSGRVLDQGLGYIGRAVNGSCWIVNPDDADRLQPHGVTGELVIAGPNVARGYVNNPLETQNSFILPPSWIRDFPIARSWAFYRTGDLAYYQSDGSLYYVGRKDSQVKHHGQRIELAEIEHCAQDFSEDFGIVADMFILPEPYGTRLVLFVCESSKTQSKGETTGLPVIKGAPSTIGRQLQQHLAQRLPGFMVPSIVISVEYLPLSRNGKLDRRRLRTEAMNMSRDMLQHLTVRSSPKQSPTTERQSVVRRIFGRILGLRESTIGIDDCFFALGGDSISAMRLLSACREARLELKMPELLKHSSVAGICAYAQVAVSPSSNTQTQPDKGPFPLSTIQRMFLQHTPSLDLRFHQSFFVKVNSIHSDIDWRRAANYIVGRHGMLRGRLSRGHDGGISQVIVPEEQGCFRICFHELVDKRLISKIAEQAHSSIDLFNGPTFSLDIINIAGAGQFAFFVAHHMVVDLVSWRLILDDLERLLSGEALPLTNAFTFQRWVEMQTQARVERIDSFELRSADYTWWNISPAQNTFGNTSSLSFVLDPTTTGRLLQRTDTDRGSSTQDILQAALLYSWTQIFMDRTPPTIFTIGHGREPVEKDVDVSSTVGWFTIARPCNLDDTSAATFSEVLWQVASSRRDSRFNDLTYFNARFRNPSCKETLANHRDMEVLLNYVGQYQKLHRDEGMFSAPTSMPDQEGISIAAEMPRFTLLEVEVDVVQSGLQVTMTFCRSTSRGDDIARLSSQMEQVLCAAAQQEHLQ